MASSETKARLKRVAEQLLFLANEGNDGELYENYGFLNFYSETILSTFNLNEIQDIINVL